MEGMCEKCGVTFEEPSTDKGRNFLSWYYIIFKLLELIGQREVPSRVPILRTKLRIRQYDAILKKLCEELVWT